MSNLTPKISIVVVTYNSGKYVTETLDSIASQSYTGEIQLIVSDDCSQDDTVLICKNWLRDHKDRFPDATIISSTSNTGISGNYNRALKEVNGLWVKYIAGDDILPLIVYVSLSRKPSAQMISLSCVVCNRLIQTVTKHRE